VDQFVRHGALPQSPIIIKLPQQEEQTLTLTQTKYFHLLPQYWTFNCGFVLDYNKLHVLHLGSACYALDYDLTVNKQLYSGEYMYPKKVVAATCHEKSLSLLAR
jgi:hypothetical protein